MKARYGYSAKGKLQRLAKIYTKGEHPIKRLHIDAHAQNIVRRLEETGHQAYIVGGALRDILLEKTPKDFDIATSAHPCTIKRLFRRARIIGRRFRIVLILLENGSTIEITTFRSNIDTDEAYGRAMFGTIDQDVMRRDFTCNALYYSPSREELTDYKNGTGDIKKRRLVPIRTEFDEDPVRMLRAVKFSVACGLNMPLSLRWDIRRNAALLTQVSVSRMTEEIMKVLASKHSAAIIQMCFKYKLLKYMLPRVYGWITSSHAHKSGAHQHKDTLAAVCAYCAQYDALDTRQSSRARALAYFIRAFVEQVIRMQHAIHKTASLTKLFEEIKRYLHPITPPNTEVYEALRIILKESAVYESSRRPAPQKDTKLLSERTRKRRRNTYVRRQHTKNDAPQL